MLGFGEIALFLLKYAIRNCTDLASSEVVYRVRLRIYIEELFIDQDENSLTYTNR